MVSRPARMTAVIVLATLAGAGLLHPALDESGPESVAIYGSGQWGVHDGYAAV